MKQYQQITSPSVAKALTHPLRARILTLLEGRTASPSELAEQLEAPLGVVSYHVRRLHALKFLKLVKRVPRRGAVEHYYTTVAGPFITTDAWRSTPTIVKHAAVSSAFQEIATQASTAINAGGFDHNDAHISRIPVVLDEQGWQAVGRELDALFARVKEIEAESHKRLIDTDHQDERPATVALMLFAPTTDGVPAEHTKGDTARGQQRRARRPRTASSRA